MAGEFTEKARKFHAENKYEFNFSDEDDDDLGNNQIDFTNKPDEYPKTVSGEVLSFSLDEYSSDEDKLALNMAHLYEEPDSGISKSTLPEILSKMESLCMGNDIESLTINEIKQVLYNDYKSEPSIGDLSISEIKNKLKEQLNDPQFDTIGEMTLDEISKKLSEAPKKQDIKTFLKLMQSHIPSQPLELQRRRDSSPNMFTFSGSPEDLVSAQTQSALLESPIVETKHLRPILKKATKNKQKQPHTPIPPLFRHPPPPPPPLPISSIQQVMIPTPFKQSSASRPQLRSPPAPPLSTMPTLNRPTVEPLITFQPRYPPPAPPFTQNNTPNRLTVQPMKIAFQPPQPISVPIPPSFTIHTAAEPIKTEFKQSNSTSNDEQNPTDSESNLCKICIEKEINCVFIECGHLISCLDCSQNLKVCPICRATIIKTVKVFKS